MHLTVKKLNSRAEVNKQVIITPHTGALFTGLGLFLPPGTCASALIPSLWTLANSLWQDLAENCDFFQQSGDIVQDLCVVDMQKVLVTAGIKNLGASRGQE